MKVRSGFISNSSSSSFIVFIPDKERKLEEEDVSIFVDEFYGEDDDYEIIEYKNSLKQRIMKKAEEKDFNVNIVAAYIGYNEEGGFLGFLEDAGFEYIEC